MNIQIYIDKKIEKINFKNYKIFKYSSDPKILNWSK